MATTQSEDPNEQVVHPRHYNQHPSGIEAIEIIEHLPANLSHAFKYIWRCGLKTANDPLRELRSAEWYVRREIARIQAWEDTRAPWLPKREWRPLDENALWLPFAERVIEDAKSRETHDLLALCLGDLIRHDLRGLAKRLEKAILGAW